MKLRMLALASAVCAAAFGLASQPVDAAKIVGVGGAADYTDFDTFDQLTKEANHPIVAGPGVSSPTTYKDGAISVSSSLPMTLFGGSGPYLVINGGTTTFTYTDPAGKGSALGAGFRNAFTGEILNFTISANGLTFNSADLPGSFGRFFGAAGQTASFTLTNLGGPLLISSFQTAVPEPATWAMMIMGVGMAGAMTRRQRRVNVSKVSFA